MCLDENQILALLHGGLRETERLIVVAHLEGCEACRHLVAAVITTSPDTEAAATTTLPAEGSDASLIQPGAKVSRFSILGAVGAGGMGIVYAAYDPELDRKVAIKILWPAGPNRLEAQQSRILREAQAMAKLTHPNVVVVHDVGIVGAQIFVVMEFVEGTTLRRWLAEKPRSWREALDVLRRAGRGLAAAHAAGLVHRDFKPDNVLIGEGGRVLVTDFGLARGPAVASDLDEAGHSTPPDTPHLTTTGAIAGTPAYMAPEQLAGAPVDARSDVFSFCVALSEALHGERPFEGRTPTELREAIVAGRVRVPPTKGRVPGWIQSIVIKGLRADPAGRPASMNELLRALDRDPSAAWRRAFGAVIAAVSVGALALGLGRASQAPSAVCRGAEQKLVGVWDAGRRAAVQQALAAGGKSWSAETLRVVEGALDDYTHAWVSMRTQACEATRVTREQSEALLDLRMRCLDGRLEELRVVTEALGKPQDDLLANATRAARSLSPLRPCADADALLAPVPLPADPKVRADVDALRLELARVNALHDLARYREAETEAASIVAKARPLGYAPLLAHALASWGMALDRNASTERAIETLKEALWAAESGRDRKLAARILAELTWVVGTQRSQPAAGHEYAHHAGAMLRGLGGDAELEALVADNDGAILMSEGHYVDAEKLFREAAEKRETTLGVDAPKYGVALVNVGVALSWQSRNTEALAFMERGVAVYGRALGEHHPLYGGGLCNLSASLRHVGRLDEARARAERALVLLLESVGPEHPLIATAENGLGLVAAAQHRNADALGHHERAVALAEKLRGKNHALVANYLTTLATSLRNLARHPEALAKAQRALAIYRDLAGNETLVARTESLIGSILLAAGTPVLAVASLERALAFQEKNEKSPQDLANTRFDLARALWTTGGDHARALALAAQAIEGFANEVESADDLVAARAWLAKARAP